MTQWEELTEVTWALSAGGRGPGTSPVSDVVRPSARDHGDLTGLLPFLCISWGSSMDSQQLQLARQRGHLFLHLLSNHAETSRASSPGSGRGGLLCRRTRVTFAPTPHRGCPALSSHHLATVSSQNLWPAGRGSRAVPPQSFPWGFLCVCPWHLSLASRVPEAQGLHVWAQFLDGDGRLSVKCGPDGVGERREGMESENLEPAPKLSPHIRGLSSSVQGRRQPVSPLSCRMETLLCPWGNLGKRSVPITSGRGPPKPQKTKMDTT